MKEMIIILLSICICILVSIIAYQQFLYRNNIQKKLLHISRDINQIIENNSDDKVMIFTDNKVLINLLSEINRLLEDRYKIKLNFRRSEISSKKMLSNISHDIKTPLTVILGYLEILRLQESDNQMLEKVENKAKQVMELINQFFTLAKLEAGDIDIEITKINISEICRESILDFYGVLTQKNIQVDISIPEEEIFALGNKQALQRILSNLLSNAVRYGADGNYLSLALRNSETNVYIDIIDKGKGIEKNFATKVFERLYTMEDSRNREIQGNGLGLTIARNLAIQLGGDITLESTPYVKTTFTLELKKVYY